MKTTIENINGFYRVTVTSCSGTPFAATFGRGRNQQVKLAKSIAKRNYLATHKGKCFCTCLTA